MRAFKRLLTSMIFVLPMTALAADPTPATRPLHPDTPWQTATSLGTATYAKILCSAIFVSGRQVEEAQKK